MKSKTIIFPPASGKAGVIQMKLLFLLAAFFILAPLHSLRAQDDEDLLKLAGESDSLKKKKQYTIATFKTTRLTNFQTSEVIGKNCLDFRIMHRFGNFNSGAYNAWGIDGPANIKLSLEYSPDGRLMFGLGRSSFQKMSDAFVKFKLLRQTTDNRMPVTVTLFSSAYYTWEKITSADPADQKYNNNLYRLSYCHQVIIARRFSSRFSLQLAPTLVHYNLVDKSSDKNDIYALCGAFRVKLTRRQALTFEFGYRLNKYTDDQDKLYYNSMGIGYELETGGHVFQVHLTNSFGICENQFIPYTTSSWKNGGIRLGFNISRVFALSHGR